MRLVKDGSEVLKDGSEGIEGWQCCYNAGSESVNKCVV